MSNVFREIGAGINYLSPTDLFIQVNTNDAGVVQMVLPNSSAFFSNINTSIYQYIGIRFSDISNNASVNNIILTGNSSDKINGKSNLVLRLRFTIFGVKV